MTGMKTIEFSNRPPPVVRCVDCRFDMDPDPRMTIRAALSCPLFGRPRRGVERQCASFVAIPESPTPASAHRSVQRGGSATTVDGVTTSGPDATSLQGTSMEVGS
jgi:hypothetical protein